MRIGFTSNSPMSATGYGVQCAQLSLQLKKANHDVAIMCNYGLAGANIHWNEIPLFGQGLDAYSNDLTPWQIMNWISGDKEQKGFGLTLYDVWVYKSEDWDMFPVASWTPIDHIGVPVGVKEWFKRTQKNPKWAIAMSKFGEQQLLESGVARDRLFYAPHAFDANIFTPHKPDARAVMQIPSDAHVTIIVSANKGLTPIRKCFPEMLTAWSKFAQNKKDAYLLLWTDLHGAAQGMNLPRFLEEVKAPREQIRAVPQLEYRNGIPHEQLARALASSDVLLMTSRGEGFGVPALEAAAVGTPAIMTDATAQTELSGGGWLVDGQLEWDEFQTGYWKVPNIDQIVESLEASYALKGKTDEAIAMQKTMTEFAKPYAVETVFEQHWKPILKAIEEELPKNESTK